MPACMNAHTQTYILMLIIVYTVLKLLILIGQPIDGPHYGPPPTPWQVQIYPQQNFKDSTASIEVPHTATVKVISALEIGIYISICERHFCCIYCPSYMLTGSYH